MTDTIATSLTLRRSTSPNGEVVGVAAPSASLRMTRCTTDVGGLRNTGRCLTLSPRTYHRRPARPPLLRSCVPPPDAPQAAVGCLLVRP